MPYGSDHVHTSAYQGNLKVKDVVRLIMKKSLCITAVFYLVAKTYRPEGCMAYKMHSHFGTGYLRGVCVSAIQPECQCLSHSGFYPMGGGKFPPQTLQLSTPNIQLYIL